MKSSTRKKKPNWQLVGQKKFMLQIIGIRFLNSIIYFCIVCVDQTLITLILFFFIFFRNYTVDFKGETTITRKSEDSLIDEQNQTCS